MEVLKNENDANKQIIESLRNELSEKSNDLRKLEMEQSKLLNVTKRVKVQLRIIVFMSSFKFLGVFSSHTVERTNFVDIFSLQVTQKFLLLRIWNRKEKLIKKCACLWSRRIKN